MNMTSWLNAVKEEKNKKPMPLLSFPSVSLLNCSVSSLTKSSELQAKGMELIAKRYDALATVSMMDLSVEAEAFGAEAVFSENEIPTISGVFIDSPEKAENIKIPDLESGRLRTYLNAVKLAKREITDRPTFAGVIGPFSLAGRLMGVSEAMMNCYDEPEMVHAVLEKATEFLIKYILEYKHVGADGVVMAEPLTGMLSPMLAEEFSEPYVKEITTATQDEDFIVIYHNCGDNVKLMTDSIIRTGAMAFHFGNSVNMKDMLLKMPSDKLVMGNIAPAEIIRGATAEEVKKSVTELLSECCEHKNFVISSGCDIPHDTKFENLDAFFKAVKDFYGK